MNADQETRSHLFTIRLGNAGRTVSDDYWEELDAAHIKSWRSARLILSSQAYELDGGRITIEANWAPVVRRLQHHYRVMQRIAKLKDGGSSITMHIYKEFRSGPLKIPCKVTTTLSRAGNEAHRNVASYAIQSFLCDIFLIMNIAAPGSCDFRRVAIFAEAESGKSKFYPDEPSLAQVPFELAFLYGRAHSWPTITVLPLASVRDWFFSIRQGLGQIPKNRMEKVLFGLLHLSAEPNISPATVAWLFYSLETLFDTKAGENLRALIERIRLLLSPGDKDLKAARKRLREMYNLRSAFIHGGLEVIHPLGNEILDGGIDRIYSTLMDNRDFGFTVLLSAVQEVIGRGWCEPRFEEVLRGGERT